CYPVTSGGQVAQLVEHRTEHPGVGGSIPSLPTILFGYFCFRGGRIIADWLCRWLCQHLGELSGRARPSRPALFDRTLRACHRLRGASPRPRSRTVDRATL